MFNKIICQATALTAMLITPACINQTSYETAPVVVATPQGNVICQLYTKRQVLWDRATQVPEGMSIKQGDAVCREEGKRQKR